MTKTAVGARLFATIFIAGACDRTDLPPEEGTSQRADELAQGPSVPTYLNHASRSFRLPPSLRESPGLNAEFARVEERTIARPDLTYTGTYALFERTYLEFLPVGPAFPVEAGALALSDETAGGRTWVSDRMISVFGQEKVLIGIIDRLVEGQPVPWFHFAFPEGVFTPLFSTWNMEFVTKPGATSPPTRQESLASFYKPDRLAKNLVAVSYALDAADGQNLRNMLVALDWTTSAAVGGRFVALSPVDAGVRRAVVVEPASATCSGITAAAISLNRHADHVEQMGDARLVAGIGGKKLAILWLRPSACGERLPGVAAGLGD